MSNYEILFFLFAFTMLVSASASMLSALNGQSPVNRIIFSLRCIKMTLYTKQFMTPVV